LQCKTIKQKKIQTKWRDGNTGVGYDFVYFGYERVKMSEGFEKRSELLRSRGPLKVGIANGVAAAAKARLLERHAAEQAAGKPLPIGGVQTPPTGTGINTSAIIALAQQARGGNSN
jgi:hypothetical protein